MAQVEEKGSADGRDDYTQDGTVSLKGDPILRSKTGRWRACSFIVGNLQQTFLFFLFLCLMVACTPASSYSETHIRFCSLSSWVEKEVVNIHNMFVSCSVRGV